MTELDQVLVIAVGEDGGFMLGCFEEGLGAEGKEFELGAEGYVPICVVFHY